MTALGQHINVLAIFILTVIGLLVIFKSHKSKMKAALLLFLACVIDYLIIGEMPDGPIKLILLLGPFLLPFSFWLLSKSMFSDGPVNWKITAALALLVSLGYYVLYYIKHAEIGSGQVTSLISSTVSLLFVLLAIYEAQKQRKIDLIEKRRKMRTLFTYFVGATVLLTLLAELGLQNADHELPKLLQRLSILIFTTYFLIENVALKSDFLEIKSKKPIITDPGLVDQIRSEVVENMLYRKETLSIKLLSSHINQQEYKVRQAINQQLGYRNFTDFINSFRIQEAKTILADPSQKEVTVLEIAYKTGFNSIGPFNRAFKSATHQTPTEFRKAAGTN